MTNKPPKSPDDLRLWVRAEVIPFDPKPPIVLAANHYRDAQAAWDAWTIPTELICALFKTNAPLGRLALCACDMVSPALAVLRSGRIDVRPFRAGIQIVKHAAGVQSGHVVDCVLDSVGELTAIFTEMVAPINIRYAARAIIRAVRSTIGRRPALDVPFLVERAILASLNPTIVETLPRHRLLPRIDNFRLTDTKIREWQCKLIRKHFPERPVWIVPDAPVENPPLHLFGHLLSNVHLS
jgi:hypothetical protein